MYTMLRDSESPLARLAGVLDELDLVADRLTVLDHALARLAEEAGMRPEGDLGRSKNGLQNLSSDALLRLNRVAEEVDEILYSPGTGEYLREQLCEKFSEEGQAA